MVVRLMFCGFLCLPPHSSFIEDFKKMVYWRVDSSCPLEIVFLKLGLQDLFCRNIDKTKILTDVSVCEGGNAREGSGKIKNQLGQFCVQDKNKRRIIYPGRAGGKLPLCTFGSFRWQDIACSFGTPCLVD